MDKEAQEKIANYLASEDYPYRPEKELAVLGATTPYPERANDILTILGYHKLPEGEPPIITIEQALANIPKQVFDVMVKKLGKDGDMFGAALYESNKFQRDSDIKWYGGVNDKTKKDTKATG